MAYTVNDAKGRMDSLINGLKAKFNQLDTLIHKPGLPDSQRTRLNNSKQELLMAINQSEQENAFAAASATVVRAPTPEETQSLQTTLTNLGRDINAMANVQAVISFINGVLSDNSQRFIEIGRTIKKNS